MSDKIEIPSGIEGSPWLFDAKHVQAFADMQSTMTNPATQVCFRAGFLFCREYMAKFVEAESPEIAASIRANWLPDHFGADPGKPRRLQWDEVAEGEIGTPEFKAKKVSASLEALPLAAQALIGFKVWEDCA